MSTELYDPYTEADELEEEDMPTFEHGAIENTIGGELYAFLKGKNLGQALGSSGEFRFLEKVKGGKKPGRQPDISFVRQERLPARYRSYPEIAPDLVVEIVSPTDKTYETEARILEYQQAGVRLIWIVNPYSRSVDVYHSDNSFKLQRLLEGDELKGEDVLPGFKLAVADIFHYPLDLDPVPDPKPARQS